MRKYILAALAVMGLIVAVPAGAQASGVQPLSFSLSCHMTSLTDGRIDTPGVTISGLGTADTTQFWLRSIRRADNTQSTVKFERAEVQLKDSHTGDWELWTQRGNGTNDNDEVGPSLKWDPNAKTNVVGTWTAMRFRFWHSDGTTDHSCATNQINF